MKILALAHTPYKVPNLLEKWAENHKFEVNLIAPINGDDCLNDDQFDMLVILGGPQRFQDLEQYPYLKDEILCTQRAIQQGKYVLGVCLGIQMIGLSYGAQVTHSPEKEIGIFPVNLTNAGKNDPILKDFPATLNSAHWHHDMAGLTENAEILASSTGCPHQIIKYDSKVYGIQCHLEYIRDNLVEMIPRVKEDLLIKSKYTQTAEDLLNYDYSETNSLFLKFLDRFVGLSEDQLAA